MRALEVMTKLRPALDMARAIAFLQRVVGCDSVTGNEAGVAALLACAGFAFLPAARAAEMALFDCHVAGIRNGVLCGSVQRPLDPDHP